MSKNQRPQLSSKLLEISCLILGKMRRCLLLAWLLVSVQATEKKLIVKKNFSKGYAQCFIEKFIAPNGLNKKKKEIRSIMDYGREFREKQTKQKLTKTKVTKKKVEEEKVRYIEPKIDLEKIKTLFKMHSREKGFCHKRNLWYKCSQIENERLQPENFATILQQFSKLIDKDGEITDFEQIDKSSDDRHPLLMLQALRAVLLSKMVKEKKPESSFWRLGTGALTLDKNEKNVWCVIKEGDCLEVAELLTSKNSEKNPLVMNMACNSHPTGGFYKGDGAQEESLCRQSNYHLALGAKEYHTGYPLWKKANGEIKNARGLLTTNVSILFKNRANKFKKLKKDKRFKVDFFAVAAKCCIKKDFDDEAKSHYKNQLRLMLLVAKEKEYPCVVLCPLGTGAFKIPAEEAAKLFFEVLNENHGYKGKIVTAIMSDHNSGKSHNPRGNLYHFKKQFLLKFIAKKYEKNKIIQKNLSTIINRSALMTSKLYDKCNTQLDNSNSNSKPKLNFSKILENIKNKLEKDYLEKAETKLSQQDEEFVKQLVQKAHNLENLRTSNLKLTKASKDIMYDARFLLNSLFRNCGSSPKIKSFYMKEVTDYIKKENLELSIKYLTKDYKNVLKKAFREKLAEIDHNVLSEKMKKDIIDLALFGKTTLEKFNSAKATRASDNRVKISTNHHKALEFCFNLIDPDLYTIIPENFTSKNLENKLDVIDFIEDVIDFIEFKSKTKEEQTPPPPLQLQTKKMNTSQIQTPLLQPKKTLRISRQYQWWLLPLTKQVNSFGQLQTKWWFVPLGAGLVVLLWGSSDSENLGSIDPNTEPGKNQDHLHAPGLMLPLAFIGTSLALRMLDGEVDLNFENIKQAVLRRSKGAVFGMIAGTVLHIFGGSNMGNVGRFLSRNRIGFAPAAMVGALAGASLLDLQYLSVRARKSFTAETRFKKICRPVMNHPFLTVVVILGVTGAALVSLISLETESKVKNAA